MIPKKIHYCWLSNNPLPDKIESCINSWRKLLPDYEIIKWDLNRFPLDKSIWVQQAFESKKYAFAADYIRLYALVNEGGIYLDSDVEVIKSFDQLLELPYFICKENSPKGVEAAIIGSEAHTPFIEKCFDYYKNKSFFNENGIPNTEVLPSIMQRIIDDNFSVNYISNINEFIFDSRYVCIFPKDYFSPKNYVNKKIEITANTYAIHHFAGSWQPLWKKIILRVWVPFSIKFPKITNRIKAFIISYDNR